MCLRPNRSPSEWRLEWALLEEILGPDNAVNGLRWRVSYGASWESLLGGLGLAFVALCHSLKHKEGAKEARVRRVTALYWIENLCNVCTFFMTVTWPRYPAVPLSTKGMSAAKHILFTWLRAAVETESVLFCSSFECAGICAEKSEQWQVICEYLCYPVHSSPVQTF